MKKFFALFLTVALSLQAVPAFAATDIMAFTDYDKDLGYGQLSTHWAKSHIETLLAQDGISGYPEGDFRANKEISAAELLAMLLQSPKIQLERFGVEIDAMGESWAEKVMNTAYALEICTETEIPLAEANAPLSREKMAMLLVNAASVFFGMDTTRAILVSAESIADLDTADSAYQDAIRQAYTLGLTAGRGIDYQPKASTTRAEAAAIVNRLMGYTKAVAVEDLEQARLAEIAKLAEANRA